MGISDYVCFIQHNDQFVEGISDYGMFSNEDDNTSNAIIVHLPGDMKFDDIGRMKLTEFAKYPYTVHIHDCDSRAFEGLNGYSAVLLDEGDNIGDTTIWKGIYDDDGDAYEGDKIADPDPRWHVNFYWFNYNAFVLGEYDPSDIPLRYYLRLVERKSNVPIWRLFPTYDKIHMYNFIVENNWNIDNVISKCIPIGDRIKDISIPYEDDSIQDDEEENALMLPLKHIQTGEIKIFYLNRDDKILFKPGTYDIEQYMIDPFFDLIHRVVTISHRSRNILPQDDIDKGPNRSGFNDITDSRTGSNPRINVFKWKDQYIDITYSSDHLAIVLTPSKRLFKRHTPLLSDIIITCK